MIRVRILLLAVSLLLSSFTRTAVSQAHDLQTHDTVAASFVLEDANGNRVAMDDLMGNNLTAIVFCAMWAKDSNRILVDLEQLYVRYQEDGFSVVGVCVDSDVTGKEVRNQITDSLKKAQITFPILFDEQLRTFRQYSVVAVPTTFLIDKKKRILFRLSGYPIVGLEELEDVIRERFKGKRPTAHRAGRNAPVRKEAVYAFGMARHKYEQGQIDAALKYAERASLLDSTYVGPLLLMAEIAIEQREFEVATTLLKRPCSDTDSEFTCQRDRLRGLLAAKRGNSTEALKLLQSVQERDSLSSFTRSSLGYALGIAGKTEEALKQFSAAARLDSTDSRTYLLRMEFYNLLGRSSEAAKDSMTVRKLRLQR